MTGPSSDPRAAVRAEGTAIISVRDLRKRYGSLVAVDGVSFDVAEGEVFGILGPNGAGKTTTLEMIEGAQLVDLGPQLLGMGVWAVITFAIAVWLFKWE